MKPDYKNWMPKGMIYAFLGGTIGCGAVALILRLILNGGTLRTVLTILFAAAAVVFCGLTVWAVLMHRAFDYNGKRQMSRQIIEGTAARVKLPAGGRCLDGPERVGAADRDQITALKVIGKDALDSVRRDHNTRTRRRTERAASGRSSSALICR